MRITLRLVMEIVVVLVTIVAILLPQETAVNLMLFAAIALFLYELAQVLGFIHGVLKNPKPETRDYRSTDDYLIAMADYDAYIASDDFKARVRNLWRSLLVGVLLFLLLLPLGEVRQQIEDANPPRTVSAVSQ